MKMKTSDGMQKKAVGRQSHTYGFMQNAGLSLVELVITLTLIGFLVGVAVPRMLSMDAVKCIRITRSLVATIRYGQLQSMQAEMPVSMGFEGPDKKKLFLRNALGKPLKNPLTGKAEGTPGSGSGGFPWDISKDVDTVTTDIKDAVLWFQPDLGTPEEGKTSPSPLTDTRRILLQKGSQKAEILVYPETGFVKVQ